MYIEDKSESLSGDSRIGLVSFSQTGRTLYYNGKTYYKVKGFKYNHIEEGSLKEFWISGCKKDGSDRLYGEGKPILIDENIREEYWKTIRNKPEFSNEKKAN